VIVACHLHAPGKCETVVTLVEQFGGAERLARSVDSAGEQDLIFHNPIPPEGRLVTEGTIKNTFFRANHKLRTQLADVR
jgi:hypothetical protein